MQIMLKLKYLKTFEFGLNPPNPLLDNVKNEIFMVKAPLMLKTNLRVQLWFTIRASFLLKNPAYMIYLFFLIAVKQKLGDSALWAELV